jgi:hypothetical protein
MDLVLIHVGIEARRVQVLVTGGLLGDCQVTPGGVHPLGDKISEQVMVLLNKASHTAN